MKFETTFSFSFQVPAFKWSMRLLAKEREVTFRQYWNGWFDMCSMWLLSRLIEVNTGSRSGVEVDILQNALKSEILSAY